MDFHLDRKLRLRSGIEKSMYSWAINEIDDAGNIIGGDEIPWVWTLNFLATEVTVIDTLRYESKDGLGRDHAAMETRHTSTIRAKLRPGSTRGDSVWDREPTYSMLGTDRTIGTFQLDIMVETDDQPAGCTAWGSVSYTAEVDFRNDTTDDIIIFYLMVPQVTYDRFVWNIAQGMCDVMQLSVGHVEGFYSGWSPSVTTRSIKVLVGSEHVIDGATESPLPRIGNIGKSDLSMTASRRLVKLGADDQQDDQHDAPTIGRRHGFRWPGRR